MRLPNPFRRTARHDPQCPRPASPRQPPPCIRCANLGGLMKRKTDTTSRLQRRTKGEGAAARSHPVVRVFSGNSPRERRKESLLEPGDPAELPPPPRRHRGKGAPELAAPLCASQMERRLRAIASSPSYLRAYEDVDFLKLPELRPVRLQLELLKPEMILQKENVRSTVVVFGGTRIVERPEAQAKLDAVEARARSRPRAP